MGQDQIEAIRRELQERRQVLETRKGVVMEALPVVAQVDDCFLVMSCQEARRLGFYVSANRTPVAIPGFPPRLCSVAMRH